MSNEDSLSISYKYSWNNKSELSLQDFLTKFKPSMVQNDGTKPWIWARGSEPSKEDTGEEEALREAANLLRDVTEKVESIKNDNSIPIRANKKTGAKSKKEVREQIQVEASEKLKDISIKHGYVCGKWLLFAPADRIDRIWSGIATSLVTGPLHSTSAYLAKVSTSSESENPNPQHLICVYLPDVYDKAAVAEVMKILLRNHGLNLSGVKSDLYTLIGIDSKHPSGIASTVWKNVAILPENEIKELKDAYFADLASGSSQPAPTEKPAERSEGLVHVDKTRGKPKLKKKAQEDDPFASDDDNAEADGARKKPVTAKKVAAPKAKTEKDNDFENKGNDSEEPENQRQALASQKGGASSKRARNADDEDERPKKKRGAKK